MQHPKQVQRRALEIVTLVLATALIVVVLWLDIRTTFWQELVIVGGIVAGFVTFLFTVLVIDKVLARSNARRWAPVTRLALTELLHGIADEHESEISRGHIVAHHLRIDAEAADLDAALHALRVEVLHERRKLSAALGTWTTFLASSDDHQDLLLHSADAAAHLDEIRDLSLEVERNPSDASISELTMLLERRNQGLDALVGELGDRLGALQK